MEICDFTDKDAYDDGLEAGHLEQVPIEHRALHQTNFVASNPFDDMSDSERERELANEWSRGYRNALRSRP